MIITKDRGVSEEELMRLRRESNVLDESILSWTNYYDVRNFTIMPLYIWRKCQRDIFSYYLCYISIFFSERASGGRGNAPGPQS